MEWQPIETAPKDGTRVLAANSGGAAWVAHFRDASEPPTYKEGWTRFNCSDVGWSPTHWMPLPKPPEGV